jgi:hypothetical protein
MSTPVGTRRFLMVDGGFVVLDGESVVSVSPV